ncbi:hypothetical protein KR044_011293, partial [Drosophila immigrans]
PDFRDYIENYRLYVKEIPSENFTGFRSAFQWRVEKSPDDSGINNVALFVINSTGLHNYLRGQIGIYSSGSQVGVQLSMNWPANFGPITCSNNFSVSRDRFMCFNSNYTLVSNAIYYLDVEIRNMTILGYISDPQNDLTGIKDSSVPRKLIGEIEWVDDLVGLRSQAYLIENNYGSSCDNTSEITTFNYAPVSYNAQERISNTYFASSIIISNMCDPANTIAITDWNENIGIFISRPSAQVNNTN